VGNGTDGATCRFPTAIEDPLPLCREHYASTGLERYAYWRQLAPDGVTGLIQEIAWLRIALTYELDQNAEEAGARSRLEVSSAANRETIRLEAIEASRSRADRGVVYFIRIGDLVKIGKTLDLKKRLTSFSYPGIELLATEPGYTEREGALHRRFKEYRRAGEWFSYGPNLRAHVASLQGGKIGQ
jgi:hypothetical protein